jgi:G3E family GTPase
MTAKTRIDLLFGFLGSGKTTLARRILEEWGPQRRMALIVNEFGDVGVDGDILTGNNIDLIQLSSGCLCCTLKGSLLAAVEELATKSQLDHIVIEATGVAEPEEMLSSFSEPGFLDRFEVGPLVTVVDVPKFLKIREMLGPFYEAQVEKTDLIILNKLDLATSELAEEVRVEVAELNEAALVRYAERCDVDLLEVLDGPPSNALERYAAEEAQPDHGPEHHDHGPGHEADADHDHHHHHGALHAPAESFVLDAPDPVDRAALTAFFAKAPAGLWRAKGFVKIDGEDMLVQFAMGELEITAAAARSRHYLVFIGDELDRDSFARGLAAVRVKEGTV